MSWNWLYFKYDCKGGPQGVETLNTHLKDVRESAMQLLGRRGWKQDQKEHSNTGNGAWSSGAVMVAMWLHGNYPILQETKRDLRYPRSNAQALQDIACAEKW